MITFICSEKHMNSSFFLFCKDNALISSLETLKFHHKETYKFFFHLWENTERLRDACLTSKY